MAELALLDIRKRAKWRAWLDKHHTSSPGVWLVFQKAHTGGKTLPYEDFVREALCFGWIDSLVKRIDDDQSRSRPRRARPQANGPTSIGGAGRS